MTEPTANNLMGYGGVLSATEQAGQLRGPLRLPPSNQDESISAVLEGLYSESCRESVASMQLLCRNVKSPAARMLVLQTFLRSSRWMAQEVLHLRKALQGMAETSTTLEKTASTSATEASPRQLELDL